MFHSCLVAIYAKIIFDYLGSKGIVVDHITNTVLNRKPNKKVIDYRYGRI